MDSLLQLNRKETGRRILEKPFTLHWSYPRFGSEAELLQQRKIAFGHLTNRGMSGWRQSKCRRERQRESIPQKLYNNTLMTGERDESRGEIAFPNGQGSVY